MRRLYILAPKKDRTEISLRYLTGSPRIKVLRDYTYRFEYLEGLGKSVSHFKQIVQMAAAVPIIRVLRPDHGFFLDELTDVVEQDFAPQAVQS